jgi:hypothetical protein
MASNEKDRLGDKLRDAEKGRETQYFAKRDRKLIEGLRGSKREELETALREAALMRCPKCGVRLDHVHEHGLAVEECAQCKGVWIDRAELQQIAGREKDGWFARWLRGEFRKSE